MERSIFCDVFTHRDEVDHEYTQEERLSWRCDLEGGSGGGGCGDGDGDSS